MHSLDWLALERFENICLLNKVINTERESKAFFSVSPISVFPANRLIINTKNTSKAPTSLKNAVIESKLRIGYIKGRSYGKEIDKQIEKYKDHMIALSGDYSILRLKDVLIQNRLDGIIEYSEAFIKYMEGDEALSDFHYYQIDVLVKPHKTQ